jgi:hypothetical protein
MIANAGGFGKSGRLLERSTGCLANYLPLRSADRVLLPDPVWIFHRRLAVTA